MGVQLDVENGGHCNMVGVPVCWRFTLISSRARHFRQSLNPGKEPIKGVFARTRRAHGSATTEYEQKSKLNPYSE